MTTDPPTGDDATPAGQAEHPDELGALLVAVLDLPAAERSDFLSAACASRPGLQREIESLMAAYEEAPAFFGSLAEGLLPQPDPAGPGPLQDPYRLLGQQLGPYQILDVLGGGGMGVVYRAEDTRLKRVVALKFLPPYLSEHPTAKQRFIQEAQAASALDHPNICTIFEISEEPAGPLYIAMAYYAGETLRSYLSRGALSLDEALDFAIQMARGLEKAHDHGITHRDIKPANVIITEDRIVKVLDFGLAKLSGQTQLTRTGAQMGTAAYMSPEQARGEAVDHRTDIWALGVMLYEMLAGQRPFPGEVAPAVIYSVLNQDPTPITGLRSGLPMQMAVLINKALAKQARDRYQRMSDLLDDLTALQQREVNRSLVAMSVLPDAGGDEGAPAPVMEETAPVQILVVDDEPELELLVRQKFRKQIRNQQWHFTYASDGREALDKLRRHGDIALVLTDINMPRMDGLTLLSEIAGLGRPIKTVVVSAYGDMDNIRTAMNRGAFDFVTKPIDFEDLQVTIQKTHDELLAFHRASKAQRQLVSLQKEFEVARRIQESILPSAFPQREDLDLYAFMTTARDVGGSFYDFFEVGPDQMGILIGDVAGRGVPAALFMVMCQTFLKGIAQQGQAPGDCLTAMNRLLFLRDFADLHVTVFYGLLDTRSGRLTYGNAGHPAPFRLRAGAQIVPVEGASELPVWHSRDASYATHELLLQRDEGLLLYTQGVTTASDEHSIAFSNERLAAIVRDVAAAAPKEIIRTIVRAVMQHSDDLHDDLTLLALRYQGRP